MLQSRLSTSKRGDCLPIYEYQCKKCAGVFETLQRFGDAAPAVCELCSAKGKSILKRIISAPQVVFKGSGFYVTDTRSDHNPTLDGDKPKVEPSKKSNGDKKDSGDKSETES